MTRHFGARALPLPVLWLLACGLALASLLAALATGPGEWSLAALLRAAAPATAASAAAELVADGAARDLRVMGAL